MMSKPTPPNPEGGLEPLVEQTALINGENARLIYEENVRLIREEGLARKIAELVEPSILDMGYQLVRVRVTGEDGCTVQIMAERPDKTLNIDDCERISKQISPLLEAHDPVSSHYRLEVSSPGIDRPLVRLDDFEAALSCEVKIELTRIHERRKRLRGVIAAVLPQMLQIQLDDALFDVPFSLIAEAKLVLTDDLIKAALKKNKEKL